MSNGNNETLTRADIAKHLKESLGLTRRKSRQIVDEFFLKMSECLIDGQEVSLAGLGKFVPVDREARPGRNPKTGEYHPVPPRRTVVFRTGSRLKRLLAGK